jgi:hypothetical protein
VCLCRLRVTYLAVDLVDDLIDGRVHVLGLAMASVLTTVAGQIQIDPVKVPLRRKSELGVQRGPHVLLDFAYLL